MGRKLVPVYLRLPEEVNQRIGQLAQAHGFSRCAYIRQIIRGYLLYLDHRDHPAGEAVDWEVRKGRP